MHVWMDGCMHACMCGWMVTGRAVRRLAAAALPWMEAAHPLHTTPRPQEQGEAELARQSQELTKQRDAALEKAKKSAEATAKLKEELKDVRARLARAEKRSGSGAPTPAGAEAAGAASPRENGGEPRHGRHDAKARRGVVVAALPHWEGSQRHGGCLHRSVWGGERRGGDMSPWPRCAMVIRAGIGLGVPADHASPTTTHVQAGAEELQALKNKLKESEARVQGLQTSLDVRRQGLGWAGRLGAWRFGLGVWRGW